MLGQFVEKIRGTSFFDPGTDIHVARAPGRLDVMGGIADYSGSLVLQWPIAEATFAAVQVTSEPAIEIVSLGEPLRTYTLKFKEIALSYDQARSRFCPSEEVRWVSYIAGIFIVLKRE